MKLFLCPLLVCGSIFAFENVQLKQVQSVYILPMNGGMDQYLANKLTHDGVFRIVTDPQKADTILTDRIGEPFEQKMDELYPPPPKVVEKPLDMAKKTTDEPTKADARKDAKDEADTKFAHPPSTLGRGRGTFFLVDRRSRAVIWSTYDLAPNTRAGTLDKTADQVVERIKKDLIGKEKK